MCNLDSKYIRTVTTLKSHIFTPYPLNVGPHSLFLLTPEASSVLSLSMGLIVPAISYEMDHMACGR